MLRCAAALVFACLGVAHSARIRHEVDLGVLSLVTTEPAPLKQGPGPRPPNSTKPLQAIKIDDLGEDGEGVDTLGGSQQSIAVVFDGKMPWKPDEQSLVSSALNRRYGVDSTALDAMRCSCTKSDDKESLLGAVDHTVSCDCQ
mgnify:CR=1 FL=1